MKSLRGGNAERRFGLTSGVTDRIVLGRRLFDDAHPEAHSAEGYQVQEARPDGSECQVEVFPGMFGCRGGLGPSALDRLGTNSKRCARNDVPRDVRASHNRCLALWNSGGEARCNLIVSDSNGTSRSCGLNSSLDNQRS